MFLVVLGLMRLQLPVIQLLLANNHDIIDKLVGGGVGTLSCVSSVKRFPVS